MPPHPRPDCVEARLQIPAPIDLTLNPRVAYHPTGLSAPQPVWPKGGSGVSKRVRGNASSVPTQMSQVAGGWAIVLVLILLPVIAFAVLPDETWVPAIYDGADGDDVVALVTETAASQGDNTHRPWPPAASSEGVLMRDGATCESSPTLRNISGSAPGSPAHLPSPLQLA